MENPPWIKLISLIGATTVVLALPGQVNASPSGFNALAQRNWVAQSGSGEQLPPSSSSKNGRPANLTFKAFFTALEASGLAATLEGPGPFTVFAPNDQAFAALPQGTLEELLKPEHKETLLKILNYHVVPGEMSTRNLQSGEVPTLEGSGVKVQVDTANQVRVDSATVILPDVPAGNGVIHVIDKVILPPDWDQP